MTISSPKLSSVFPKNSHDFFIVLLHSITCYIRTQMYYTRSEWITWLLDGSLYIFLYLFIFISLLLPNLVLTVEFWTTHFLHRELIIERSRIRVSFRFFENFPWWLSWIQFPVCIPISFIHAFVYSFKNLFAIESAWYWIYPTVYVIIRQKWL